jgi:hypothetical protein
MNRLPWIMSPRRVVDSARASDYFGRFATSGA